MKCNGNNGCNDQKNAHKEELSIVGSQYEAPKTELIELASVKINSGPMFGCECNAMCIGSC